ncbi:MAG: radical SAM protein [Deltaproteobacteria bacterium]
MDELTPIRLPDDCNYIAAFLTLGCNLKCSFCINRFGSLERSGTIPGRDWVRAINRIMPRKGLPVTLQGGEPALHVDFIRIINDIKPDIEIDILTNLQFDETELIRHVSPERLKRDAPYASIRVSYHPEAMELKPLAKKVLRLKQAGFSVGIWAIKHPLQEGKIIEAGQYCAAVGIDFRTKEFLGFYDNRLYGTYSYPDACAGNIREKVLCRTTELIIGSDCNVYRCHGDLYAKRAPVGNMLDNEFSIKSGFRECGFYGTCNPCDVKLKTNRQEVFGHTSVEIKGL